MYFSVLRVGSGRHISVPKPVVDLQKEPMRASSQFWAGQGGDDDSVSLWRLDPGKISGSVMTDDLAWS